MHADAETALDVANRHLITIAGVVVLSLGTSGTVQAEQRNEGPGSIALGARGGFGAEGPVRTAPSQNWTAGVVEFNARVGIASDYIYRGTTLSARQPAGGAAFEAAFNIFYAGASVASVNLPTQPSAEIATTIGVRPTLGKVNFDFGWTYFHYPGETVPPGSFAGVDYWEAVARADTKLGELMRVAGGFAYSPNVSNTGAWSKYVAFGLGIDAPSRVLPEDVSLSLTGSVGYSWFGSQSVALGGFPLPAYLNWNAGVTLAFQNVNFDLRYHDTNLSRENCYVFTGDPNAVPGGRVDPVRNPDGLMSRWCSAAVVAKFWLELP